MQQPGQHEAHGTGEFHEIDAHELRAGQRLLLPDGHDAATVLEVDTVLDDYDHPALYFAVLDNHLNVRVAHGTRVRVVRTKAPRPADLLFSGPTSAVAAAHDGDPSPSADVPPPAPGVSPSAAEVSPSDFEITASDASAPLGDARPGEEAHDAGRAPSSSGPAATPAPLRGPSEITLETGDVVIVPGAAPARTGRPNHELLARIPAPEVEPEELMAHLDAVHPGRHTVNELAGRLAKGINVKSGACLADLRTLAYELYIGQGDAEGALKVADLLAVLPYDGNPGRWTSIESALGLAAHLARVSGDAERAAAYGGLLRAPETEETDPFRARMAERMRTRALNQPNLYDKEISRASAARDHEEERAWRLLRFEALLHLRAHGGSEAFEPDELERRIEVELDAIRA
ncbi:DUF6707 family protein [Sinomonas halotolerans]|uniref:DUF6707 family protein n=1 Tax=Sinomonas halotolerans TaxID=1644133 RepID=A0ABU9X1U6_9MICC